jgi:hypothetical protein
MGMCDADADADADGWMFDVVVVGGAWRGYFEILVIPV